MPKRKPKEVKLRGRSLNNGGLDPAAVLKRLDEEFGPDAPSEKQYRRWMKESGWLNYKIVDDLPATMNPDIDADVSNIKDPILHLSVLAAKRSVVRHDSPSIPITNTIRAVLLDVHYALEPGANVLSHLRRSLRSYIRQNRGSPNGWVSLEDAAKIEEIIQEVAD